MSKAREFLKELKKEEEANDVIRDGFACGTESLEEAASEIDILIASVESEHEVIDELCDVAGSLETISEVLENPEGLNKQALRAIEAATKFHTTHLGIEDSILPSLESFEENRETYINVSLESFADTIRKVWEAIKRAIKKAIEAIKSLFEAVFGAIPRLERRKAALEGVVSKLKTSNAGAEIRVKGNILHVDGKLTSDSILKGLDATAKAVKEVYDVTINAGKLYVTKTNAAMIKMLDPNAADDDLKELASSYKSIAGTYGGLVDKLASGDKLPGGYEISVRKISIPSFGIDLKTSKFESVVSYKGNNKMDAFNPQQMREVLNVADKIIGELKRKKEAAQSLIKVREKELRDWDSKMDRLKRPTKVERVVSKALYRPITMLMQYDITLPMRQITSIAFRVTMAALAAVEKSARTYKEGQEILGALPAPSA